MTYHYLAARDHPPRLRGVGPDGTVVEARHHAGAVGGEGQAAGARLAHVQELQSRFQRKIVYNLPLPYFWVIIFNYLNSRSREGRERP